MKVVATAFGFLTSLLLARLLGVAGYGIYAYALSWINLLTVPATFGLDTLLIRNVAAYQANSEWGLIRGLLRRTNQMVLTISLILTLSASIVAWFLLENFTSERLFTLLMAFSLVPFMALIRLRQGTMRGLRRVVLGQAPELLIRPLLLLAFLAGIAYFFCR